jgi:hypothetical protein
MTTTRQPTAISTDRDIEASTPRTPPMRITIAKLVRWAGLAAVVAGLIFAGIQPIHPPDELASVTTPAWAIITPVKTAMCLLFLLGITGLYARQANKAGWLGLAGYLLLSLSWALQTAFVFAEAFIVPLLATTAPQLVDGLLGLASGHASAVDLGALPALYAVVGIAYMLGGLLFGVATLRAGVLPRWPAALLAVASAVTPAAALLPHQIQRLAAIPVALALAWLGFALLFERAKRAAEPNPAPSQITAEQGGQRRQKRGC